MHDDVQEIVTIPDLRRKIKEAKIVFVAPRFGLNEGHIKLSKKSALDLIANYEDAVTPEECEMYGGAFGSYYPKLNHLYLG